MNKNISSDKSDNLALNMIQRENLRKAESSIPMNQESLFRYKNDCLGLILETKSDEELTNIQTQIFGKNGSLTSIFKNLSSLSNEEKPLIGKLINEIKTALENAINEKLREVNRPEIQDKIDITEPGILPKIGHLHPITQAINEIEDIFSSIGFTRRSYPEVVSDWYNFEGLNILPDHPARDEQETFFLANGLVLSTHTSSGQLKEMERRKPPIRMINIARCYRRQSDSRHLWMFHQFEGLAIDKNINITHLKGTIDYFTKRFFGPDCISRIRPHHFQFTEPSFEVDFSCTLCNGKGCKICKEGWLELGGAGMVHPNVLKNGGLDPEIYSGFAFGWGVERTFMCRPGVNFDDTRMFYQPDLRILEQF